MLSCVWDGTASTLYVSPTGGNLPPFATWANAATNIQDAIDAASGGDLVWVTNGVYSSGGKVVVVDLTNRVVLDKALTVKSVNGPALTVIQGAGAVNGTNAIRCAWLTNGAVLDGFTLQGGATRAQGTPSTSESGGGAWGYSTRAVVTNCILTGNNASSGGGAAYQITLLNCNIQNNTSKTGAIGGGGGGAMNCNLTNCLLSGNSANGGGGTFNCVLANCAVGKNSTFNGSGGGAYGGTLINCTLTGNTAGTSTAGSGGGAYGATLVNCIVYNNQDVLNDAGSNYSSCTLSYSCSSPLPSGTGNISVDPQLLVDGVHLSQVSPCRGAGLASASTGTDIDGQPWANPPSIGCDEWLTPPVITATPQPVAAGVPLALVMTGMAIGGQEPFGLWWYKDGTLLQDGQHYQASHTSQLVVNGFGPTDAGAYQLVASNAFGMATSAVAQVVVHCVDAASATPVAPFSDWSLAASNIQDAIDAAAPGDFVLVTNGLYSAGGRVMAGDLSNTVAVTKPLTLASVNGASVTFIQGLWDPGVNGPLAARAVWLTNSALVRGFTIRNGATRATGDIPTLQRGGGVWGTSTNTVVADCVITWSSAFDAGGGAYQVLLTNCLIRANTAIGNQTVNGNGGGLAFCNANRCLIIGNSCYNHGGGAYQSLLLNSAVTKNSAVSYGGGVATATLINCTVSGNWNLTSGGGGGANSSALTNCIIFSNHSGTTNDDNYVSSTLGFCCTAPLASGPGNLSLDPQFLSDGLHIGVSSPCRGAGTNTANTGTDIDGQAWAVQPSIGCDEWWPAPVISTQPCAWASGAPVSLGIGGFLVAGQEPISLFWMKEGLPLEDNAHFQSTHSTNLVVNSFGPLDAGNYLAIASNSFGMVTSSVVHVTVHCADANAISPFPPYTDWSSAAATIQDAIDVAADGDFVLVTNGIYAVGGRVLAGDLTNRIAATKAVTVTSVNGTGLTTIQGAWDPISTNGPLALRCAALVNGAVLNGFTLQGGATRATGEFGSLQSGGGLWAQSTNATVFNCLLTNNSAAYSGGGAYSGHISNSKIIGNMAYYGGGASASLLTSSFIWGNSCGQDGAGLYRGTLVNSTLSGNNPPWWSWGSYDSFARNSVIFGNYPSFPHPSQTDWGPSGSLAKINFCCAPGLSGTGNITNSPQLLSGLYLPSTSPCWGAGSSLYVSGTDIDGEPWANPPSMGCDELWLASLTNALSVNLTSSYPSIVQGEYLNLFGQVIGRPARLEWAFGDGTGLTNASYLFQSHIWTNVGDYTVTFTAYNAAYPAGVSANLLIHVIPMVSPMLTITGFDSSGFRVSFPTQPGVNYYLLQATNLTVPVTWRTISGIYGNGAVLQLADLHPTNIVSFYRIWMQ